jgi:hypothetical protein
MFIGHFALGFGAKKAAPAVSLGTLFVACQLADLLWPTLVLTGIERVEIQPGATAVTPLNFISYPYSHSLVALGAWALLFGVGYVVVRGSRIAPGAAIAILVLSHWLLDFITHRRDMPLTLGGGTKVGLDLWASRPATVAVEAVMFAVGVALYARATAARDRIGSIGLWSLIAFMIVVYVMAIFGPVPPSTAAVAWTAESLWLLVAWAYWVDGHRRAEG